MWKEYSVIPVPNKWPKIPPGQDRFVFSDSSMLHGQPAQIKTRARLSLENILQDIQRAKQANQAQVKAGLQPNPNDNKFRDSKPRLLLMGLRRYVQSVRQEPYEEYGD
jgi:Ras-related GTP-binding protein C/D